MKESTLYKLINAEFDFQFGEKTYHIRRAGMDKYIQYRKKVSELAEDKTLSDFETDARLVSYCIYIMLADKDPEVTEQWVFDNLPGDIDILECLATLGFMSLKKLEQAKTVEQALERLSQVNSSPTSQIKPDGLQEK